MHGSGTAAGALVVFVIVCVGRPQGTKPTLVFITSEPDTMHKPRSRYASRGPFGSGGVT
jgi:hypothetical protein